MSQGKKGKIVHTELKETPSYKFELIKENLGIQNDAEVVRFLIQYYYKTNLEGRESLAQQEADQDRQEISRFMKKYGKEWRKLGEEE
jgi:hypothetical protein